MNVSAIRFAVVLCSLATALPASAVDIRPQLTPDLIYDHCRAAGAGSETEGTFMLPNGRVTGTVLCTAEDLTAPKMSASAQRGDDDDGNDDHGGRRNAGDDDDDREDDDRDD